MVAKQDDKKDDKQGDKQGDKQSDREGAAASSGNDILLHETMMILGDYVELLGMQPQGPRLAGPRKSASAL